MLRKIVFAMLLTISLAVAPVKAVEKVNAYLFYGEGCPHCAKARDFFAEYVKNHPELHLTEYEVYYNKENSSLMGKVAAELGTKSGGVPFLVIGDKAYVGFAEGITNKVIEARVEECKQNVCNDVVVSLMTEKLVEPTPAEEKPTEQLIEKSESLTVPILGRVDISKLSLPILTIVVAGLDGFNPCAMWTLLFLISLLLGMKDKRRMWILGSAFIMTSALVYFLFMAAWLNLFMFLGYVVWIRAVVGLVALGAGGYYLRDYYQNKKGGCQVMGNEKRQQLFVKLRTVAERPQFYLALGRIMALAVAVNVVELVCSAGLPAIYTQILSLSQLTTWQYYLYLGMYILIFMLDDLFIFFTAMITLRAVGVESKYARYSHLVGGILMLIIGLILLLKPELLMFG